MHSNFKKQLIKLNACKKSIDWIGNRTFEQAYNDCKRGDWLLWLYAITTDLTIDINHRLLTLAKAKCADTVRHLMKDVKSVKAVDIAIAYGEGKATKEELAAAYVDAYNAYVITYRAYSSYSAYGYATIAAYSAAYATHASISARKENQKLTAEIVRSIITIDKFIFYAQ